MEGRKYDIVVFGATGVTGQHVVYEVARVAAEEKLKWAIAGRTMDKLQKVLSEASAVTGTNLDEIPIIIADVSSPDSLEEMAKQTKVVLNCVGPYRFHGETVVKACIEAGTNHLDVSGEPQYLEKMQLLYNGKAKEKNVFIIGATGFDSLIAEMAVLCTKKQFKDGEMTNAESYLSTNFGPERYWVNYGTYESAVYGVAYWKEMETQRKSLYPEPMPKLEYKLPQRSSMFYSKDVNKWCLPFMGSDKSVVYRTVRDLLATKRMEKPFEYKPYVTFPSLLYTIFVIFAGLVFVVLANFSIGRTLLLKFPGLFTMGLVRKGGPTKKQIEDCTFTLTVVGYGYEKVDEERTDKKPDKIVVTKLTGPDPGYITTSTCMVQSAVVLLKNVGKLFHKGGVLTAAAVFLDTDLVQRLDKHNIKFSVVSDSTSSKKD